VDQKLKIAYAIQNVGGIDFTRDVGDVVPVKQSLRGLARAGHQVDCFRLEGRTVARYGDVFRPEEKTAVPTGLAGSAPFKLLESGVRRLQRELRLPYFALFDSYRFYQACLNILPAYDLCHEHNGLLSTGAARACARTRTPYVLTFSADPILEAELTGAPLTGLHLQAARRAAHFTYQMADRILCVSKPARQHLIDHWGVQAEKIVVMPNGVDTALFAASYDPQKPRQELALGESPVVTFVGGFQPWHGIELLVEAFARVLQQLPQAKLLLVGDGPAREGIERKTAALGIEPAVVITGFVPQQRVPEYLAAADVAVIPYPRLPQELWFSPLKLYEYMAAGKAVAASRSGQIAEVIRHEENGLLFEPGSVDEMAAAVTRLLQSPDLRRLLGESARRQAVEQHSWDQYIRRLEGIYEAAIQHACKHPLKEKSLAALRNER